VGGGRVNMLICEPCNLIVTDKLLNKWFPIRSKEYSLYDLVSFTGADIDTLGLGLIGSYLEHIAQNYFNHNLNQLPEFILKEANYFKKNNCFSVYLILILFKLFEYFDISMKDLKFYNGYVFYEKFSDYYFAEDKCNVIPHPFIIYKGAIIDYAIYSEYVMLPIEFKGFVFGQSPTYIRYYGIEEELYILYNYYLNFLKETTTTSVDLETDMNLRFNNHKAYLAYLLRMKIISYPI
jgi:hypothetical protein